MYKYERVEQQFTNENIGEYTAYGIILKNNILIEDVTSDKIFADKIIKKLNNFQVSPIHIKDVIENLIIQQYSW